MPNFSFKYFVDNLSDTSFIEAKKVMQEYQGALCKMQKNESVSVLLKTVCKEHIIQSLQKEDFTAIMDSLFYDEIKNEKIVLFYMEKLNEVLADDAEIFQKAENERAARYYKYQGKILDEVKNKKSNFLEKTHAEQVTILNDYTKIVIALYVWVKQCEIEEDTEFDLNIDKEKTELFLSQLAGVSQSVEILSKAHKFAVEKADIIGDGVKIGFKKGISVFAKNKNTVVQAAAKQVEQHSDKLMDFAMDAMKPGVVKLDQRVSRKIGEMEQFDGKRLYIIMIVWLLYLRIGEEDAILQEV